MHISLIAFLVVVLSNQSISGVKLKEACKVLKRVNGNIDQHYPRPNGCIMEFTTARGKCCAIGFRKVHKLIFHETFLKDKTCYRFRCRYLKGKKKKRWEKCGCKKIKIKLSKETTLKPTTKTTIKYTTRPHTTVKVTTRRPTTTPKPPGCFVNGVFYPYESDIPEYSGQQDNWCYGAICGDDGNIMHWDNFNCNPTTRKTTTLPPPPPTTTPRKTTTRPPPPTTTPKPPGCFVNGVLYPYDSDIPEYSGQQDNWCYGAICGYDGSIMHWDNFNCNPTTSKKTTLPPTTTQPPGCFIDGKLYQEGQDIPKFHGKIGNWCYGKICGPNGKLLSWDNYDCYKTTPKTTIPPKSTKFPGCTVLGKFYKVNDDIHDLFKKEGNYCVSYFCNEYLELEKWEDYNCGGTTPLELLLSTPPMRMPTEPIPGGGKGY